MYLTTYTEICCSDSGYMAAESRGGQSSYQYEVPQAARGNGQR